VLIAGLVFLGRAARLKLNDESLQVKWLGSHIVSFLTNMTRASDSIHSNCKPPGCENTKNTKTKLQSCHELRMFIVHQGPTRVVSSAQSCICMAFTSDKL